MLQFISRRLCPLRTNSKYRQNTHLVTGSAQFTPGRDYVESGRLLTAARIGIANCRSDDRLTEPVYHRYAISVDETSLTESAPKLTALHESERSAITAKVQPKFAEARDRRGKTKSRN